MSLTASSELRFSSSIPSAISSSCSASANSSADRE
jgi:hypothetical protein